MTAEILQWILVIGTSVLLFLLSPLAKTKEAFFKGEGDQGQPSFWVLTSSLVISWLFAKSITNAANLGMSFGMLGGIAYAGYYLSFVVAGVIIYQLRTKGGFTSIHHFLESKFGKAAIVVFSLFICFRLLNEVWSNAMVIGSYFGDQGSTPYLLSVLVFTFLTVAYTIKGGMSSSLFTDVIQMALFGVLLTVILFMIFPRTDWQITKIVTTGEWTLAQGGNLLLLAILQSLSYPFHDPVLTDRGFVTDAKTTFRSYMWAAVLGGICILLFSFVGIFAQMEGLSGQAPVEVAKILGVPMMLLMNFIMITSAASTLDSTFSSFSKLALVDLRIGEATLSSGRLAMVLLAIVGILPVFFNPEIISATTISGTMVIGLAPVFLFWKKDVPPLSFYLSVVGGFVFALIFLVFKMPADWIFSTGKYADLLAINIYGTILCFILFFIPSFFNRK